MNILTLTSTTQKLKIINETCHRLLQKEHFAIPELPGRDVEVLPIRDLPPKKGLSYVDGQARLLHDLASIELQAMELGVRTLAEYPDAPEEFRRELAAITINESEHLNLCLEGLDALGKPWGSYPVHVGLWQSVAKEDSLIDRVLIVHRYLEGSGLDASHQLLNRLSGIEKPFVVSILRKIAEDEIEHVRFGSRWFMELCNRQRLDPDSTFRLRLDALFTRIPRRLEKLNVNLRKKVGFSNDEIATLERLRLAFSTPR